MHLVKNVRVCLRECAHCITSGKSTVLGGMVRAAMQYARLATKTTNALNMIYHRSLKHNLRTTCIKTSRVETKIANT